jgi:hypothetical protein
VSNVIAKQLDRRELVLAVWSAEFARALDKTTLSATHDVPLQRRLAEEAAKSADLAVEALRLLVDDEYK